MSHTPCPPPRVHCPHPGAPFSLRSESGACGHSFLQVPVPSLAAARPVGFAQPVSSTHPQRCEGCSRTCGVAPFSSMGLPDQPRTGLGDRQPPRAVPEGQSLSPWARGPSWEAWSPAFASGGRCPQDLVAAKRRHGPETPGTLPMTNSEKSERAGVPGDAQPGSGSRNESPDLAVRLRCFPGNE